MISSPMAQLFALIIDRDADKVTEELLRLGVVHFINMVDFDPEWAYSTREVLSADSSQRISDTKRRIESLMHLVGIYPELFEGFGPEAHKIEAGGLVDFEKERAIVEKISEELENIRKEQRIVQAEIEKLKGIEKQLEGYGMNIRSLGLKSDYSLISIQTGIIPQANLSRLNEALRGVPSAALPFAIKNEMLDLLLIFMKRDAQAVETILKGVGWRAVEISQELRDIHELKGTEKDVSQGIQRTLTHLHEEREKLEKKEALHIEENAKSLKEIWIRLRIRELFDKVQSFFMKTSRTVVFSGWVPEGKREVLSRSIIKVTKGNCYLEWHEPKELVKEKPPAIPVQLRNPRLLAPFQMLVTRYGIPEYGSIDPTPFVTVSYLIMFGLMFADVGHGAVLALLGIVGMLFFKRKNRRLKIQGTAFAATRNDSRLFLAMLVAWCGCASIASGFLFGSFFGMRLLPPLWFDFHGIVLGSPDTGSYVNDIFDILRLTLYFGIAIIGIGFLFNWINHILKKRWRELFFFRDGLPGGWIYGGGAYTAWYLASHGYKALPELSLLFFLMGIPVVLLLIQPMIHFFREKKGERAERLTLFTFFYSGMEWMVELFEIVSSYLSNTLSFMRVAGLGIAHASLMIAFFRLARMASAPGTGYGFFPVLIIVSGNILVIVLEGLVAGIQSLRLHYYEFFSKFFHGSGEPYSPLGLKSSD